MDLIVLTATAEDNGKRLDLYISQNSDYSRNSVQILLDNGDITVNNKSVTKSYKIKDGDCVQITVHPPKDAQITPENIPLDIYYEDSDLLVVYKPKGMVVHPANGNESGTLVNALMFHCKDSLSGINGEIRPGIVHRIDKDTSGLLMIAKNDRAHLGLSELLKTHDITRKYHASS